MSGLNKVIIMGNLGQDPKKVETSTGNDMCRISLATSEKRGDKEFTEWHNIVCFGKTAELVMKYMKKGKTLLVEGSLRTNKWEDKETGQTRYKTEIISHRVTFVGRAGDNGDGGAPPSEGRVSSGPGAASGGEGPPPDEDDDLPF
jgi:single-strand DNA-binding protein